MRVSVFTAFSRAEEGCARGAEQTIFWMAYKVSVRLFLSEERIPSEFSFWKMRLLRMQPGLKEGKGSVLGANSQLPPSELWFHLPNFFSSSTFPPSFSHSNQSTAAINVTQHAAVNSSVQFCRTSENIPRIWLSADETCLNYPHYLPLHIPYALFVFLMLGGGGWIVTKKKKNLQIEERRTSSQKYIHNCKSG